MLEVTIEGKVVKVHSVAKLSLITLACHIGVPIAEMRKIIAAHWGEDSRQETLLRNGWVPMTQWEWDTLARGNFTANIVVNPGEVR